ncbi:hypothetical protein GCM10022261_13010 [Brevibacterium daeguense]|uniref:SHOCT domain-containing protein n=1 Tax=Brevibacterium daeguense TaxID=909936 RepID=A0ABP8EIQ4_9MICO|nr:SHOCT domain-containing protein [Brevibacterium daeguense]
MMYGMGTGGMWWIWVFGVLLLIGVIVLVVVLVQLLAGRPGNAPRGGYQGAVASGARAREILAERYARGELSTEEYRERLRTLEDSGP